MRRARASRKASRLDSRTLWTLSIGFSVLCTLAVLAIWLVITLAPFPQGSGDPILSQSDLDHYLAARPSATAGGPRILIPTGVFIQSIKFDSAFDPVVSGYVWQVYGLDVPQDVTRGFILPDGDDIQSAEAYRETRGGAQVIGWSFQATLRQEFLYNNYPFDRHYLWVRVDPADVSHNIMLMPDFPSYSPLRPTDLPGVQPKLVLEDWQVRQAFFSYHTNLYNTNLGVGDLTRLSGQPELYYSVGLSHHILGAFITYIIPPLVALIMLFGVLILTTRRQALRDSVGWSSTNVLAYTVALFFVIIVSHVNLRQQVSANGVLYLGWFYILTYLAILLVSINAVVFILASERQLIQREDNLVSKLLYWPVLSFALLVITVVVFILRVSGALLAPSPQMGVVAERPPGATSTASRARLSPLDSRPGAPYNGDAPLPPSTPCSAPVAAHPQGKASCAVRNQSVCRDAAKRPSHWPSTRPLSAAGIA